jgi:hypothetical protein
MLVAHPFDAATEIVPLVPGLLEITFVVLVPVHPPGKVHT